MVSDLLFDPRGRGLRLRVGSFALALCLAGGLPSTEALAAEGWRRLGQQDDRRERDIGPSHYAPTQCRWVQIAKEKVASEPGGREVYVITQKNSCTGKQRSFRTN